MTAARYELDNGKRLFVKLSTSGDETMFKGEALGLQAMYGARIFNEVLKGVPATKCLHVITL